MLNPFVGYHLEFGKINYKTLRTTCNDGTIFNVKGLASQSLKAEDDATSQKSIG